jgi:hypothetical protein
VLFNPGTPPINGSIAPSHMPAGAGTQGIGVKTPSFAAVAAATCGLAIELHIPHGSIFAIGAASCIVATGMPPNRTFACEVTRSEPGAVPIVHAMEAPVTTGKAIKRNLLPSRMDFCTYIKI